MVFEFVFKYILNDIGNILILGNLSLEIIKWWKVEGFV